jgi:putative transcriptional regulator
MFWTKGENPVKIDLGTLLVASLEMEDEYFKNAVILISAISPNGVLGYIINRPLHVPVKELFNDIDKRFNSVNRLAFVGGPVNESELSMISFSLVGGRENVQGIRLGGRWNTVEELLDSDEYENRVFMGYTGWLIDQLSEELSSGESWIVYNDIPVILAFAAVDNKQMYTSQDAISALNLLAKKG